MSKLPTCEELVKACQPKEKLVYTKAEVNDICGRMLYHVGIDLKTAIRGGKKGELELAQCLDGFAIDEMNSILHPENTSAILSCLKKLGFSVQQQGHYVKFTFNL